MVRDAITAPGPKTRNHSSGLWEISARCGPVRANHEAKIGSRIQVSTSSMKVGQVRDVCVPSAVLGPIYAGFADVYLFLCAIVRGVAADDRTARDSVKVPGINAGPSTAFGGNDRKRPWSFPPNRHHLAKSR